MFQKQAKISDQSAATTAYYNSLGEAIWHISNETYIMVRRLYVCHLFVSDDVVK